MELTKKEVIHQVNQLGFNWKDSTGIVESLLEIIKQRLEDGEDVLVSGFAKFSVREKLPGKVRNPVTGSELYLDGRRVVNFRCSGKLRKRINGGK